MSQKPFPPACSQVSVRRATPQDVEEMRRMFIDGIWDNVNLFISEAIKLNQWVLALAGGLGLAGASIFRPSPTTALLSSTACIASAAGCLALQSYQGVKKYVRYCLTDDMADFIHHYSDKGAGPGSQIWVAELSSEVSSGAPAAAAAGSREGQAGSDTLASPTGWQLVNSIGSAIMHSTTGDSQASSHDWNIVNPMGVEPKGVTVPDLQSSTEDGDSELRGREGRQIVGMVALQYRSKDQAELRRMSVSKTARRCGVAAALARTLLSEARASGFRSVILHTTSPQAAALQLYHKLGWEHVCKKMNSDGLYYIHSLELDLSHSDS